jgi:FtsP/CotA-like multicopper oxidase with cupredoxin domain
MRHFLGVLGLLVFLGFGSGASGQEKTGVVRTYYIAADEVDWDYMPHGAGAMDMGMSPDGYPAFFAKHSSRLIGHVYRKALYREYTDGTFTHLKPRAPEDAYLGSLGPIIHAEVGDTIHVVFRNHGTHPYSMHPHGVLYDKASEGSDPMDGVAPGKTRTYVWNVTERSGPGPNDPSSIVWLYHSHINERRDVNAGLIGAIVVTRAGMATPDGRPKDVDREFFELMMIYDENRSWFIRDNVRRFVKDKTKFNPTQAIPLDPQGNFDPLLGTGFASQNFRATINGYSFENGPAPQMKRGDHVRWYVVTVGEGLNFHTAHWHGNTVLLNGSRTDVGILGPASMITADMVPDNPGTWMFHCHVSEHMEAGMSALYHVLP